MAVRFVAAVLAVSLLASAPAAALELDSVQVHLGMADLNAILDGSKAVPLIEPTVEVEPAFSGEIDSYTLQVPDGVDGITLVLEAQQFDPLPSKWVCWTSMASAANSGASHTQLGGPLAVRAR